MEMKIFYVLLLAILWMHISQAVFNMHENLVCARDVPPKPLLLEKLAGTWYEIGRAPKEKVFKCLNLTVPKKTSKALVLQVDYIATYDGSNRPKKEKISFPWDNFTQNSIFHLYYGHQESHHFPTVVYRVIYTDYRFITVICGYSAVSPTPLFKILSRQRVLDQKIHDIIQEKVDSSKYGIFFIWSDQTNCNAANCSVAGSVMSVIIPFGLFMWRLFM